MEIKNFKKIKKGDTIHQRLYCSCCFWKILVTAIGEKKFLGKYYDGEDKQIDDEEVFKIEKGAFYK